MKLTGKCKEEFEKWFVVVFLKHSLNYYESTDKATKEYVRIDLKTFYTKNKSMQYGVYVDFFDSVGIYINSGKNSSNSIGHKYNYTVQQNGNIFYEEYFLEIKEPRDKSIEKADELRNEVLNK